MAKKFRIPGVSFSAKRALGITAVKSKIARATGIPTTAQGRRRKFGLLGLPRLLRGSRSAGESTGSPFAGNSPFGASARGPSILAILMTLLLGGVVLFVLGVAALVGAAMYFG